MLPLAGYAESLSARPGQTLRFHVANATAHPVKAQVVRVICADPNPEIGGVSVEPVSVAVRVINEPGPQPVPLGSYATLGPVGLMNGVTNCSVSLTLQPTLALSRRQVLLSSLDDSGKGLELELTPDLQLQARFGTSQGLKSLLIESPLQLHEWSHIRLSIDTEARRCELTTSCKETLSNRTISLELHPGVSVHLDSSRAMSLASASDSFPVDCFNGKLENPVLLSCALGPDDCAKTIALEQPDHCLGAWDFSQQMQSSRIVDTSPHAHHGELVNTPTRAMRGSNWTGEEHCFRHAPQQYAAIHFHDDDLADCRWPATHEITIPDGFRSDAYALMLSAGEAQENIPFFVVPPKGTANAKIAVLVSTYTYTIYGNHARPEWMSDEKWRAAYVEQAKAWKAYPYNPGEHRDYGLSTYNYHTDGSGIAVVSWRRPMLNLRVGYITYPYPEIRSSGLRHYPADSHLLMWLAAKGYEVDLITDYELHHEGRALLDPYSVVVTGSHPEYHTPQMLDALQTYRDAGGRLVYLGGNGFYWKIALDPAQDGVIEIRRGEGGIRAWAAEPGEYYNQFDAQYGGLWRRNARPPQKLVGVGFTAQGNFVGSHYRINPDARSNPKVSWILDGVKAETVGGEGFSGHGAAGFELDRVDKRLGSPRNAVVIASSEDHPPEAPWVLVPEEQLTHITTIPGQSHKQLIRADMTYFDCPGGGEVFSVGSITFCGSLPVNHFDNDISRILDNVIKRFSR